MMCGKYVLNWSTLDSAVPRAFGFFCFVNQCLLIKVHINSLLIMIPCYSLSVLPNIDHLDSL